MSDRGDLLVVEDEANIREFVRAILKRAQIPFRMATSGTQALMLARAQWPAAILLDLTLPGRLDGWQVWQALSEMAVGGGNGPLRIIVFTADDLDPLRREQVKREAYGFVRKPVTADQLVPLIREALERVAENSYLLKETP